MCSREIQGLWPSSNMAQTMMWHNLSGGCKDDASTIAAGNWYRKLLSIFHDKHSSTSCSRREQNLPKLRAHKVQARYPK